MKKYLEYEIENLEPLKTSATLMQSDNETSKSYISGSVMKGAYIANYISINKVKDINSYEHKSKLLKGDIKFLNAYPENDMDRTYPFPLCFYTSKSELKNFRDKRRLKISQDKNNENINSKNDVQRLKGFEFVRLNFNEKRLVVTKVNKNSYLHIKKAQENENNKLFRYEAIQPFNKFKGIVEFSGNNIDENIEEFIKITKEGTFYLGGSKGTGYGLCKIRVSKSIKEDHPEWLYFNKQLEADLDSFINTNKLYLYTLSDIIIRDSFGVYQSYIDPKIIEKKLGGVEVELCNSFIQTETFTGFNSKWGYRLPLVKGIKAGSVIEYNIQGKINIKNLKKFIQEGIGERKIDGFGRFILLNKLDFTLLCNETNELKEIKEVELNPKERNQMQDIVNKIYNVRLDNVLIDKVLNLDKELKKYRNTTTSSQWAKLFMLMCNIENLDMESGIKHMEQYFNQIKAKTNNRELINSLNKIKIYDEKLINYLVKELKDLEERNFCRKNQNKVVLSGVESQITKKQIYRFKLKVLKEAFRLQYKNGEVE